MTATHESMATSIPLVGVNEAAEQCIELANGGSYRRYRGSIIGAPQSLRAGHECQIDLEAVPPPARVATLRNVRVYGRCLIMTDDRRLIRESLINTRKEFGPFRREADGSITMVSEPKLIPCRGAERVVLLKQEWDRNYGHWLVESLPRVGMIAERYAIATCRFIVGTDCGAIGKVYRDTLSWLGVPPDNIVPLEDGAFEFEELIYPTPITVQPWIKAPRVIHFLERLAASRSVESAGPHKIYVARNTNDKRRLKNEDEIVRKLIQAGYQTVTPGSLDFESQVRMFRDATHVVGILGAGLTNIVFSPRGVQLLALTSEYMQDDFFWDLICHKAGRYTSLHGKAIDPSAGMQSDFTIDCDEFAACFASFERGL